MSKKSFILHVDTLGILDELTNEQAGQLFKLIYNFHNPNKPKETEITQMVNLAFYPFKTQFERDLQKYENVIERNKKNGALGGRPKKKNPNKPKKADSDSDSDSDSDKDKNKINLDLSFVDSSYLEIVERWLNYKKTRREKYKNATTIQTMYNKLLKFSNNNPQTAELIIDNAISNNYSGFFELRGQAPNQGSLFKKPMYWHFTFKNNLGDVYYPDPVPEEEGESFKKREMAGVKKPVLVAEYLKAESWRK